MDYTVVRLNYLPFYLRAHSVFFPHSPTCLEFFVTQLYNLRIIEVPHLLKSEVFTQATVTKYTPQSGFVRICCFPCLTIYGQFPLFAYISLQSAWFHSPVLLLLYGLFPVFAPHSANYLNMPHLFACIQPDLPHLFSFIFSPQTLVPCHSCTQHVTGDCFQMWLPGPGFIFQPNLILLAPLLSKIVCMV